MRGKVSKILSLVCIAVFVFSAYKVIDGLMEYRQTEVIYEEAQDEFVAVEEEKASTMKVDFEELLGINDDVVGWIYMDDTVVSYPVLQSTNNKYYLDRTLYEGFLASGSIFMDYRSSGDFSDSHSIIYGHNMKNHTMFGDLDMYTDAEYLKDHPYIYMFLPDGNCYQYEIYSVYTADVYDGTFELQQAAGDSFSTFINLSVSLNIHGQVMESPIPDSEDKIITLSTCTEDSNDYKRLVIHGVLVDKNAEVYENKENSDKESKE